MNTSWRRSLQLLAVAGLATLPAAAWSQVATPAIAPAETRVRVVESHAAHEPSAGDYWIGVQLEPLPEIVTSQLKLDRGMVVVQVYEDSPAAKAEFKSNDIILRAADKDVKGPQDLISAVNEAKDKEMVIVALRGGTETTLKVTPAKRQAERAELRVYPGIGHRMIVEKIDELQKGAPDGDVRLFAVRPGGVYAYTQSAKFPENLEVTIEKRGDKPATIRVKRIQEGEDKTWEVTEDKLGELPEDVRVHVQQLLNQPPPLTPKALSLRIDDARAQAHDQAAKAQAQLREAQKQADRTLREYHLKVRPGIAPTPATPVAPPVPHVVVRPQTDGTQAKLDAILKKLDQQQGDALQRLQKEVEQLRKDLNDLRQEKK